jgi:hypothetical protein
MDQQQLLAIFNGGGQAVEATTQDAASEDNGAQASQDDEGLFDSTASEQDSET